MSLRILHIILSSQFDEKCRSLANKLTSTGHFAAIHIDKKANLIEPRTNDQVTSQRIHLVQNRISVYRAHISIFQAMVNSYREMKDSFDFDYVNLLSGVDFPVRPLRDFELFLQENQKYSFINCIELPVEKDAVYHDGSVNTDFSKCAWPFKSKPIYFFDRLSKYNYSLWDKNRYALQQKNYPRLNTIFFPVTSLSRQFRTINKIGRMLKSFRSIPHVKFHIGSGWYTIKSDHLNQTIAYLESRNGRPLKRFFKSLNFADEFVVPTVMKILDLDLVDSDLRYVNWNHCETIGRPGIIDQKDIPLIQKSNAFFCRKVDLKSIELIEELLDV
ncbi:MAG: hypothetical protein H6608_11750 [Flavobacteriales bacterium]|nr:hypothetical protein [Bacteroidota bacterium]MCB9241802.1 hypothetical protein [Flavobacteriales bacterium]